MKSDTQPLKICMVHSDYFPFMKHNPALLIEVSKILLEKGHNVDWITISNRNTNKPTEERIGKLRIFNYDHKLKTLRKFLRIVYIIKKAREEKYSILHIRNDVVAGLAAIFLKLRYNIPFVFDYTFIFGYSTKKESGSFKFPQSLLLYLQGAFEILLLKLNIRFAEKFMVTSDAMLSFFEEKGILRSKMVTNQNAANPDLFSPKKFDAGLKKKLGIKKAIIYVGGLNYFRQSEFLIRLIKKLYAHDKDIKLILVGKLDDKLTQMVKSENLQDCIIETGTIPYSEVPKYLCLADIALSPLPLSDGFELSAPIKIYEYLSCQKPVLATNIPEQAKVVAVSKGGLILPFDVGAFASAIIYLFKHKSVLKQMGINGRKYVLKVNNYHNVTERILNVYMSAIKSKHKQKKQTMG